MNSKNYILNHLIITLGIFTFGVIGVCAATYFPSSSTSYDNSSSGMTATNVQNALDELYTTCFPPTIADDILDKVPIVTTGDGLYKDEYEDRYFYKGTNPNNYITFNGEKAGWRIMSLEGDGTIKIIKNTAISSRYWNTEDADLSGIANTWGSSYHTATLNTYLNETYYNNLTSDAKNQITKHNFSVGRLDIGEVKDDLKAQITDENGTRWSGKLALATASEVIRTNSNVNSCGTSSKNNSNYSTCKNTNWMINGSPYWLVTPTTIAYASFYCDKNGRILSDNVGDYRYRIVPTLYLKTSVQITGGDGSQSNPYILG